MVVLGGRRFPMSEAPLYTTRLGWECGDENLEKRLSRNDPLSAVHLVHRGYSKSRTHTALGPYGTSVPRSIGPFQGRCVSLLSSNPCKCGPLVAISGQATSEPSASFSHDPLYRGA